MISAVLKAEFFTYSKNCLNGAKNGFCERLHVEAEKQPSIITLQRAPRGTKTAFRGSANNFSIRFIKLGISAVI